MENLIDRINEIIETENLRERTKKPTKVHRRWFLFSLLRNKGVIFQKIGDMFGMDHATILYGVRQVEIYKKAKDEFYLMDTADLEEIFNNLKYIKRIIKYQNEYTIWRKDGTLDQFRFGEMMIDIKNEY